jgi:hypothetical protein
MRRISTILFILALLTGPALAQSNDDILKRLDALEKENAVLRARVNKLEGPPGGHQPRWDFRTIAFETFSSPSAKVWNWPNADVMTRLTIRLAHHDRRRGVVNEAVRTIGSNEFDPEVAEHLMLRLLHDEIAGKAVSGLDNHDLDAVAGDAGEQGSKAWPRIDRVGAAHSRVVKLGLDLVAGALGEGRHGLTLALLTIPIRPE